MGAARDAARRGVYLVWSRHLAELEPGATEPPLIPAKEPQLITRLKCRRPRLTGLLARETQLLPSLLLLLLMSLHIGRKSHTLHLAKNPTRDLATPRAARAILGWLHGKSYGQSPPRTLRARPGCERQASGGEREVRRAEYGMHESCLLWHVV